MNMRRLLIVAALGYGLTAAAAEPKSAGFEHFVTRRANRLVENGRPYRFVGANMPGLVLPYDWTLSLPERLHLPTAWEQEDAFQTLDQMNFRVVRLWNLPICPPDAAPQSWHYVLGPGRFNDEAFKTVDRLFALANKYRVRVIFDFTAEAGDYLGGIGTYAAHRGKARKEFYTDPQVKEDYKATLRYVLRRVNTITGVPYREEKAVLAWQFGNEMYSAPDAWLSEMAAEIKRLAPKHLVAETRHRPGHEFLVDPNIDLLTRHLYANYKGVADGWIAAVRGELERFGDQRPVFIGEFGPYIDGKMFTPENVVAKIAEFSDFVQNDQRLCGSLLWSMYFHHEQGGHYWHQIMTYPAVWSYHWPGFPSAEAQREIGLLRTLREAAFRIEGKPTPPVSVPPPPTMLPPSQAGVPLLSWRGSAGAEGYDLQRAASTEGPWTTVAGNVSDADVAYRPLWSDTTVRPGDTVFYRAAARNSSGVSAPSKPVGPIAVEQICLVDELQDFARAAGKSDGLELRNDYNALYAEYLFRAEGKEGDWIAYRAPLAAGRLKVVGFYAERPAGFVFEASADGKRYAAVEVTRKERPLPAPPLGATRGKRRTMVEWEGGLAAGTLHVRLRWTGPMELDRVEIYCR